MYALTIVEPEAFPGQRDTLRDDDGNGGPPRLGGQSVWGYKKVLDPTCSRAERKLRTGYYYVLQGS